MITHATDNIYIGNVQDAIELSASDTHTCEIFTVAKESPFIGQHHYKIVDGKAPENEEELGYAISDLIKTRQNIDGCILVHCVGGISRSPAVVVGYIMEVHDLPLSKSYDHVKTTRPQTRINMALLDLLKKLDN